MAKLRSWSAAFLLSTLVACGGKSFEMDPVGDGGTDAGGTAQGGSGSAGKSNPGGTGQGGTATAGTGQGGTATAGTGQGGYAGSACEGFADQAEQFVRVTIVNKTSGPIHLGDREMRCESGPRFDVHDARGGLLRPPGSCRSSCQDVMKQGPLGCPAACLYPSALTLQSGELHHTDYRGRYVVPRELPPECVNADYGGSICDQAVAIQPGTFIFSAEAGTSLDCSISSAPCSVCAPNGEGGCTTPGSLISGKTLRAKTQVYLDGTYGVYGVRRLPEYPGGADQPGGVARPAQVELVFTD